MARGQGKSISSSLGFSYLDQVESLELYNLALGAEKFRLGTPNLDINLSIFLFFCVEKCDS